MSSDRQPLWMVWRRRARRGPTSSTAAAGNRGPVSSSWRTRSAAAAIGQPSSPGCTLPTCRIPTRQWGADFGSQLPTAVLPERAGSLLVRRDGVGGDRVVAGLLQLVLLDLARLVAELAEHLVVLGHERVAEAGPVAAEPLIGDGERDRDDGAVQLAVALGRVVQDRRDPASPRLRVGTGVDA